MRFFLHKGADAELDEAVEYYEDCQIGLGLDFAEEVYSTIARISEYPDAWTQISTNTRRCLVNRFPYAVIFQVRSEMIYVVAVSNLHRRPHYWENRI